MKKLIFILAVLIANLQNACAQMTLAHHYAGPQYTEITEVNLSRSGKKILTMRDQNGGGMGVGDTLFFYNMDYSFWKMIPCPHVINYEGVFNFNREQGQTIGIFYPSEELFNLDTFLEAAVLYYDSSYTATARPSKILVINEQGTIMDSILNVDDFCVSSFNVHGDSFGNFHAYVTTTTGADVYALPGSLPFENYFRTLGLAKNYDPGSIISQPIPNPSKDQLKITFTLPAGVDLAELKLYDMSGRCIKSYQVDTKFGVILLDNSQLAAGTYIYNIMVNGGISSSQKFLVVR